MKDNGVTKKEQVQVDKNQRINKVEELQEGYDSDENLESMNGEYEEIRLESTKDENQEIRVKLTKDENHEIRLESVNDKKQEMRLESNQETKFFNKIKGFIKNEITMKELSKGFDFKVLYKHLLFPVIFCYLEFVFHLFVFKSLDKTILFPLLYAIVAGCFVNFWTSCFSEKIKNDE